MTTVTYKNPLTGQTQVIGEDENVRRRLLETMGWALSESAEPPVSSFARVDGALVEGTPVAEEGSTLIDVSDHGSEVPEYVSAPTPAPRRKKGA